MSTLQKELKIMENYDHQKYRCEIVKIDIAEEEKKLLNKIEKALREERDGLFNKAEVSLPEITPEATQWRKAACAIDDFLREASDASKIRLAKILSEA